MMPTQLCVFCGGSMYVNKSSYFQVTGLQDYMYLLPAHLLSEGQSIGNRNYVT